MIYIHQIQKIFYRVGFLFPILCLLLLSFCVQAKAGSGIKYKSEDDDSFLLQSVSHLGNSIVLLYDVDEKEQDLELVKENSNNEEYIENIAAIAAEDADVKEFFGVVALSRSNIVLQCVGRSSKKEAEILLPYEVIRKYCKVPAYLLSH